MLKGRGWFGGGLWKPKNPHSLEHLRYLYNVLHKNQTVSENNRSLLVEILRSIAEILIWGDQNDSSVFDFFLEKNMLSFFLTIMKQKCGSYVCVQLLQTLNILFENIRNETSLYYLLSNNHVNSIIVHKFDFSDEEVMAYYISFLKTLSLKLNAHTIHFFYNEHSNDFPLYTEAIKFFNHSESMVRIAVRTLTLNVYKVDDQSMLRFIRDRTAVPYFSNLVWFIGNHILELDTCIRTDIDHSSRGHLDDLVAEHLDHLHYINDIFRLNISTLNNVLADHLLNRLLVPLLVYSLMTHQLQNEHPRVNRVLALFLLSQVVLIISYSPLIHAVVKILLHGNESVFSDVSCSTEGKSKIHRVFVAPEETLEKSLQSNLECINQFTDEVHPNNETSGLSVECSEISDTEDTVQSPSSFVVRNVCNIEETNLNITDEEKEKLKSGESLSEHRGNDELSVQTRPFLQSVLDSLKCLENDYCTLFGLCLLYALGHNQGINQELLEIASISGSKVHQQVFYSSFLMELILNIVSLSTNYAGKVRVTTLELSLMVMRQLINNHCNGANGVPRASENMNLSSSRMLDQHLAVLEGCKEEATLLLRNFYKSEEIFLDMFEDEWQELNRRPLNVEYLLQDASILLPPAGTPLTGIEFSKRLPCGEVERARHAMRIFFLIRKMCLDVRNEIDTALPLTNPAACIQVSNLLDLNGQRLKRFLVVDVIQLILVEPVPKRMGWGVAKFVGFLQHLEVSGDKDDGRVLHITIHRPSNPASCNERSPSPIFAAKFVFDDHIRCMAAKQRLTKGLVKAKQRKLHQIARLLELPSHLQSCPSPPTNALSAMRQEAHRRGLTRTNLSDSRSRRSKFSPSGRIPGHACKRDSLTELSFNESGTSNTDRSSENVRVQESSINAHIRVSRSTSQPRPRSEEIPLSKIPLVYTSHLSSPLEKGHVNKPSQLNEDKQDILSIDTTTNSSYDDSNNLSSAKVECADETKNITLQQSSILENETSFTSPPVQGATFDVFESEFQNKPEASSNDCQQMQSVSDFSPLRNLWAKGNIETV